MQRIKNYGSFLQAYALKKMIEELGYEVEFVDYRVNDCIIKNNKLSNNKLDKIFKILSTKEPLIQKIQYIIHKKNFGKKYYKILGLTSTPNYTPVLDTLVIGSDEVFNCIQSNPNVGYSLELFGKDNNANKVITYAASFGNTTLSKIKEYKKYNEIKELLSEINTISTRDKNSYIIAKTLTQKNIEMHLDPVLIYDYMNNYELIPTIDKKEKYLIVYAYSGRISKEESKYIRKFAKKRKLKVYAIGGAQKCADKFIDCSPFETLAYFKNANCIITDTFHGSIFSIINQKKFITLVRKSVGSSYGNEEKLSDLLEKLNLSERIIYNINEIDNKIDINIDYKKTFNIIQEERIKALEYLKRELKKCIQN